MDQRTAAFLNEPVYAEYCCRYDGDLILESYDDSIYHILGIDPQVSLVGKSVLSLYSSAETAHFERELWEQLNNDGDVELFLPMGEDKWVFNRGRRICRDGIEEIRGVLVSVNRIKNMFDAQKSRLAEYEERLSETEARAARDSLTRLLNAQTTRDLCEEYIRSGQRNFALLVIDVDQFKYINDHHGHMVGDHVLMHIAKGIRKLFRNNDIVGRIGGDEFLVLMKDVEDRRIVEKRSAQINEACREILCDDIPQESLSCSVGVVFAHENREAYDTLFCLADEAMYRAKVEGGGRFNLLERTGI